nr:DNA cytosine methyltransferase [Pluralibacter gergoviae]
MRRAGWPDTRPAWTASCPCQPFSQAGKGLGFADERHLWPSAHWLVGQRRPIVVFGEQSGSADANDWIDLVQADVEALGYAFGACAFPSASVGAPHTRDRAYWVADADRQQWERSGKLCARGRVEPPDCGAVGCLANADSHGRERGISGGASTQRKTFHRQAGCDRSACWLAAANDQQRPFTMSARSAAHISRQWNQNSEEAAGRGGVVRPGPANGFWRDADWLFSRDDFWRPVSAGSFPLADGIPGRVGRLRAYGNAINIEAAAQFIRAYMARVGYV